MALKIMPLGDSIAYGYRGAIDEAIPNGTLAEQNRPDVVGGWRDDLKAALGDQIDFVGDQNVDKNEITTDANPLDGPSSMGIDKQHQGYPGKSVSYIYDKIKPANGPIENNHPQAVFLMTGSNDVYNWAFNKISSFDVTKIKNIVDAIHAKDSSIEVFVSTIPPQTNSVPWSVRAPLPDNWENKIDGSDVARKGINGAAQGSIVHATADWNKWIIDNVPTWGDHVHLVNMTNYSTGNPKGIAGSAISMTGYVEYRTNAAGRTYEYPDNGLHPNDAGYATIAGKWKDALVKVFPNVLNPGSTPDPNPPNALAVYAISAAAADKAEGNAGQTAFTFTVSRSGDVSQAATLHYAVTSAAANGADFGGALPSGTISFAANKTSTTLTVNVAGDTTVENDEPFTVTLSNPSAGTIAQAVAQGTIRNDDGGTIVSGTTVSGTSGNDALNGTSGNDSLLGLAGDDTIRGGAGNDTCVAGPGLDFFFGEGGADVCLFSPGEGKDKWFDFQDGIDKIALPAGLDYSQLAFRADTTWNYLWVQSGGADVLGLKNIGRSQIDASDFVGGTTPPPSSNVAPVANNNSASTTPGTAVEIAVLGNDTDANGDVLSIASFTQPANGTVVKDNQGTSSTADDALVYTPKSSFTSGTDTFSYTASDGSLTDNATVTVTVGTAPPANTVSGTTVSGTSGNDALNGTTGNDSLLGLAGDDTIRGGAGNDTCVAGPGLDFFFGEGGADVCLFSPGEGKDKWFDFQDGIDKIALPAGLDYSQLTFRADTTWNYLWVQSGGADVLGLKNIGRSQIDASDFVGGTTPPPSSNVAPVTVGTAPPANTVSGTSSNDALNGTSGDDSLLGLAGNDSIYGLDGNDTCVAGPGFDFFYGGPGADVCRFSPGEGQDKWWDYQDGTDKIALPAGLDYSQLSFRADTTWNYLWVQSGGADVLGLKNISRPQIDASDFIVL